MNYLKSFSIIVAAFSSLLITTTAQASSVDKALYRMDQACNISYRTQRVIKRNVKSGSAKLIGSVQTMLHKDGRLVLIDLDNRCAVDQIRIDEGPVTTTKAIGKRLFMVVKNQNTGKGRLYMTQAFNSNRTPYRVFEVKYRANGSYAQAHNLKVINKRGQAMRLQIIKKNGQAYKRLEEPSKWGNRNNSKAIYNRIEEVRIVDERTYSGSFVRITGQRQVTLLPVPVCSGLSVRLEYLFGLVEHQVSVRACI